MNMSDEEKDKAERSMGDYKRAFSQIMVNVDENKMSLKEACEKADMPVRFMRYFRKQQKARYERLKQKVNLLQGIISLTTMITELEERTKVCNPENPVEGTSNNSEL
jgi:hypothetical protein